MQTLILTRFQSPRLYATETTRAKPIRRRSYEALEAAAAAGYRAYGAFGAVHMHFRLKRDN